MRIGHGPPDEWPVNVRCPVALAEIADRKLLLAPMGTSGSNRTLGHNDQVADWIADEVPSLDVLMVSVEQLVYGGLMDARTTRDLLSAVLARLDLLRPNRVGAASPQIFGFNQITCIPNGRDGPNWPPYWREIGPDLYRLSQMLARSGRGEATGDEAMALRRTSHSAAVEDRLWRR